jgi:hypothetical protein
MKPSRTALFPILVLPALVLGCSAYQVKTNYDAKVDFTKYKTFAFAPKLKANGQAVEVDELVHRRAQRAIEQDLRSKGFALAVPGAEPDLQVVTYPYYHQASSGSFTIGFGVGGMGGGPRGASGAGMGVSTTKPTGLNLEGSLIIEILDARARLLIWQGVAEGNALPEGDPASADQRMEATVKATLAKFPPNTAK